MRVIFYTEFGSHVYGTSVPESDRDFKGVYVPSREDILLQRATKTSITKNTKADQRSKNSNADVDVEYFTLQSYLRLLSEGQTVALDMLFTPEKHWLRSDIHWDYIQEYRDKLIHRGVSGFVGYVKTQAAKYGIKGSRMRAVKEAITFLDEYHDHYRLMEIGTLFADTFKSVEHMAWPIIKGPNGVEAVHWEVCNRKIPMTATVKYAKELLQKIYDEYGHRARQAERNEGVDYKALYHAVRVCEEAKELLSTGHITFPRPEAALLLEIRKGNVPYVEIAERIERGIDEVKALQEKSLLPDKVDNDEWDRFIMRVYAVEVTDGS